ncbi:hypothetical protein ACFZ8E_22940 [Methylobacterium sp. HMF5984]|uniref:hypothetical protein n=1 Tax=Methylobacterium sp. HMF5984 TaxID=3367370 RepID=UPI0038537CC5
MILTAAALRASILYPATSWGSYNIFGIVLQAIVLSFMYYIVAAIQIFFAIALAEWFAIRSKYYYLAVNFVVSMFFAMWFFASFKGGISFSTANFNNFGYIEGGLPIVSSGTFSALVYWYISGRHAGRCDEQDKDIARLISRKSNS